MDILQILTTIALLCGHPTTGRYSEDKVVQCQKYYVHCFEEAEKKGKSNKERDIAMKRCIFNRDI